MKEVSLPEGFHDLGEKPMSLEITSEPASKAEVCYPSLFFRGKDKLKGLPKSGTAIIHFKKVVERTETIERDGKSESSYCVELEIHGIKPEGSTEEIPTGDEEMSNDDAIEKGLAAASREYDETETETEEEEESED